MKTKKILFYILMFLPLAAVLISLQFLPEQIPAHYNAAGQVDRWGSKYEALIIPALTIVLGCCALLVVKLAAKHEESGRNNARVCVVAGITVLALFNAMTGYFLYTAFQKTEDLSISSFGILHIWMGLIGLSMVITGNIMPKLRMNSIIGLRTVWSMKNELSWKKSQRFGGISMIIGGIATIAACFLAEGSACVAWSLGILILITIVDVFYTYIISKKC